MDKIQMIVRIPAELKRKLKRLAVGKGLTLNAFILKTLWEYIDQNEEKQTKRR